MQWTGFAPWHLWSSEKSSVPEKQHLICPCSEPLDLTKKHQIWPPGFLGTTWETQGSHCVRTLSMNLGDGPHFSTSLTACFSGAGTTPQTWCSGSFCWFCSLSFSIVFLCGAQSFQLILHQYQQACPQSSLHGFPASLGLTPSLHLNFLLLLMVSQTLSAYISWLQTPWGQSAVFLFSLAVISCQVCD